MYTCVYGTTYTVVPHHSTLLRSTTMIVLCTQVHTHTTTMIYYDIIIYYKVVCTSCVHVVCTMPHPQV